MNENEFDRAARIWLEDGPNRMSDRALLSALEEIHATRQRRAVWPAWRAAPVSTFARIAVAAALVAAVGLLASNVVPRQPDGWGVGGPPSPSQSQAVEFQNLTTTFVSPTNGFSFRYLDRGRLTPAKTLWDPATQPPIDETELNAAGAPHNDGFDVEETGFGAVFQGASTEIPDGVSIDAWVDAAVVKYLPRGCGFSRSQQAEITIDGQSGRISEDCWGKVVATVVVDGRLYLFILSHNRRDARAVFDAFAATIDLRPDEAAEPSSTPAS